MNAPLSFQAVRRAVLGHGSTVSREVLNTGACTADAKAWGLDELTDYSEPGGIVIHRTAYHWADGRVSHGVSMGGCEGSVDISGVEALRTLRGEIDDALRLSGEVMS